ncbi:MAG TPA: M23 family metallopeptidase [Kofleriaceae bacterium]|nr:M23 family metallopeptidase [Kofleriaceae bacterium]
MSSRSISRVFLTMVGVVLLGGVGAAAAETRLTVHPATVRPGEPVLVSVTGSEGPPRGTAAGHPLVFFPSRTGYQAVFAIPLDAGADQLSVEVDSAVRPATVEVVPRTFPETSLIVEEEMANPPPAERRQIDADNAAILAAVGKARGDIQFARPFRRPPGEVTSVFGEWRTFNDGHRSQHVGLDLFAREGSRVRAINAGKVVLVRDCFLAGTVVVVAHGGGIASAYFHLSQVSVAEGDTVGQGTEVGLAGHTGRTTGPHLHVSVWVPGGLVDPTRFFQLPLAPAPTKITQR